MSKPFILVLRPHQRPAKAYLYSSEKELVSDFMNGHFKLQHAEWNKEETPTFEQALEEIGHDMYCCTLLWSKEEVCRYLNEPFYCGAYNKGLVAVINCAQDIGWL